MKIRLIFLLSLLYFFSFGQNFTGSRTSYMDIDSYSGNTNSTAFQLSFDSNVVFSQRNWKVSVKLLESIRFGNEVFPPEKISIRPQYTVDRSDGWFPPVVPTVEQIVVSTVRLSLNSEQFIIPNSQARIYNNSRLNQFGMDMILNLVVEGGSYLHNLPKNSSATFPVQFTYYNSRNQVIGIFVTNVTLRVGSSLSGQLPNDYTFALFVDGEGNNSNLAVRTMSDYRNGTSVTYSRALRVYTTIGYQLTVRSINANFVSTIMPSNTLPLSSVIVGARANGDNDSQTRSVELGTAPGVIATGNQTGWRWDYYDLIYSTKANDPNLIDAKMEDYSTIIQYQLIPL